MNSTSSPVWTSGTTEVYHTGTWRRQIPVYLNPPSPCQSACPVDGNIALWIQQIKEKDFKGAWETLTKNNPFPSIAGRICHHPCESPCNRGDYDEAVSIRGLERYIGDLALTEGWSFPPVPISKEEKIAIIGAGPAGLSASYHLRRLGYRVTIYEAQSEPGGLLRYGIPAYRLDKDILEMEIQRILDLGVELRCNSPVRSRQEFQKLNKEYDAVYMAIGAEKPNRLSILDYEKEWVIDGADYLARTNSGDIPEAGKRIVVIGGGSAAMDVARTARRFNNEVTILSLEAPENLPCQQQEVVESEEENIKMINGAMLQSVIASDQHGLSLNCTRVIFHAHETRGQFSVEPVAGSDFEITADIIITAIGQNPKLTTFGEMLEVNDTLIKINEDHSTSQEGVFAGGDVTTMERFVTHAVGMGKEVSDRINQYFNPGRSLDAHMPVNWYICAERNADVIEISTDVNLDVINLYYYDHVSRNKQPFVSADERLQDFEEVQLGFSDESALNEAGRCFSCGNCIFCNNCLYYCPDMAITRNGYSYEVNDDYCKGCGLCVVECPTGSIKMLDDR